VTAHHTPQPGLLQQVSRAVFWNTALLPLIALAGMLLSVIVRRSFGLESGYYDVALGVANSILFYSSLGLSGSLPKFIPELQLAGGRRAAAQLIARLGTIRLAVVVALVLALNLWAEPLARSLELGSDGTLYLRLLSALLIGRAALDFAYRALDSFFRQFSVNLLSLIHGVLDVALVALVIGLGWQLTGVIGALGLAAIVMAIVASIAVMRHLRTLPPDRVDTPSSAANAAMGDKPGAGPLESRIWKLSAVTYVRDLSLYFATPAFASPVLLKTFGSPEPVAIFATSYFVASSVVTLVVSGFRGIYRPAFAHVMAGERAQLQRAFDLINKVQVLAVVPAGAGLAVMVGDYLPLLYGEPFYAAVPTARILIVFLFAETALAVGLVVLWVDEQYRPVLAAQAVMVAGAPLFIWTSAAFGLLPSAMVLGASRLAASALGNIEARRLYDVRYPWRFAAKVTLVSLVMVACLAAVRAIWPTSLLQAAVCTFLGVVIVAAGLRLFRVLGPGELELLERASIPGKHLLVRWLSASRLR
jgi:O-antigen/teichoic acid export membrane protein